MTSGHCFSASTAESIKGKTILLDTNVIVNGYQHPKEFQELLQNLSDLDCELTTIEAVRLEFFSQNRSLEELTKKVNFYNETITYPELPTRTFEQNMRELSLLYAFGMQVKTFQTVDFMLAAAMKRYSKNILLLTNDHNGFTPRLFDLQEVVPLVPECGSVVAFGLYSFAEDKYAALLRRS
jgi:hypothetical protein